MNYTKAKIFNMTLKNLGISQGVQSSSQGDRNTSVLQEFYETALYKALNDYDWGFASSYAELTPALNKTPHPHFMHCYDYPNKCLKIRELFIKAETPIDNSYSFESRLPQEQNNAFETASDAEGNKIIYTDVSPAIVRYTRMIENEIFFPPEFAAALSWMLAFLSAAAITGTRVKTSDCLQIYKKLLLEASVSDANEGMKNDSFENEYINARN